MDGLLRKVPFDFALERLNRYNFSKAPASRVHVKKKAKYILRAHGVMLQGFTFTVPTNINFITITKLGEGCSIDELLDKEIIEFYKAGYTIFENNDLSEKISSQGEILQNRLKGMFEHIEFKNHLGDSVANEMVLDFVTGGLVRGTGILNLNNLNKSVNFSNRRKLYKNLFDLYSTNQKGLIQRMLLSNVLTMYDHFTFDNNNINRNNGNKKLTFILMGCRNFMNNNNTNGVHLARQVSGKVGNRPSVRNRPSNNILSS